MTTSQNAHSYLAQYGELIVEERQVEATLAVAFEQRTANLIALYGAKDLENSLDFTQWSSVLKQIKERVGLE